MTQVKPSETAGKPGRTLGIRVPGSGRRHSLGIVSEGRDSHRIGGRHRLGDRRNAARPGPAVMVAAVDLQPGHATPLIDGYGTDRIAEVVCDVADPHSVRLAAQRIDDWGWPVRSLVNCAGI